MLVSPRSPPKRSGTGCTWPTPCPCLQGSCRCGWALIYLRRQGFHPKLSDHRDPEHHRWQEDNVDDLLDPILGITGRSRTCGQRHAYASEPNQVHTTTKRDRRGGQGGEDAKEVRVETKRMEVDCFYLKSVSTRSTRGVSVYLNNSTPPWPIGLRFGATPGHSCPDISHWLGSGVEKFSAVWLMSWAQ